jgi:hypothetical protein
VLPQAVSEHYRAQQALLVATLALVRREWARMGPDFDVSWAALGRRILLLTTSAQLGAARSGAAYVPATLTELGTPVEPEAEVLPAAFAGMASDGRPLDSLLGGSVIKAKAARGGGAPVNEALAVGGRALDMYVHTQVADAARGAASVAIVTRPTIGWVRLVNVPCCARCAILAGKWFGWNGGFQRHPQCFPAGVVVSGPAAEAATRRWYEGELVVLSTESGQNLPLTSNHPVLTSRGWVPANLLREGDEVVRSTRPEGANALVVPDHDQVPSLIEDVWAAFRVMGLDRVPSTPEDFHGDGRHGEVDVVRAHSALRNRSGAALLKEATQQFLAVGAGNSPGFCGQGTAELLGRAEIAQSDGAVGGGGLSLAFLRCHLGGADEPSFAGAASLDPQLSESVGDRLSRDAVLARDGVFAGASGVGGHDRIGGQVQPLPRWDAPGDPFAMETAEGYASRGRDLLDRLAGQVELDRVVELRRSQWSGHVFSLTSTEGWHAANSYIVSNCDCRHIPAPENVSGDLGTTPAALFAGGHVRGLSEGDRRAIADGADPGQVVNARRGRQGMTTTEGTTKRGLYGGYVRNADGSLSRRDASEFRRTGGRYQRTTQRRLTPDAIYSMAADREHALELLRQYGYIR